jgi:hypothetical protein
LAAVSVNLSEHEYTKESGNFCRFLRVPFGIAAPPPRHA